MLIRCSGCGAFYETDSGQIWDVLGVARDRNQQQWQRLVSMTTGSKASEWWHSCSSEEANQAVFVQEYDAGVRAITPSEEVTQWEQ